MKKDGIQTRKRKPKNPINVLQANTMMKSDMKGSHFCNLCKNSRNCLNILLRSLQKNTQNLLKTALKFVQRVLNFFYDFQKFLPKFPYNFPVVLFNAVTNETKNFRKLYKKIIKS